MVESSLWADTVVPVSLGSEPSGITLGTWMYSNADGFVTHFRYYRKQSVDSGPHTGVLYDQLGNVLATKVFSNESTGTGWRREALTTPVQISANTPFLVAYHTGSGAFSVDPSIFQFSVDTPPLHGYASAAAPGGFGNGVFAVGASPTFPNSSNSQSAYYADIVWVDFIPTTYTVTLTESLGILDDVGAGRSIILTDTFGLLDSAEGDLSHTRTLADPTGLTDSLTIGLLVNGVYTVDETDPLGLTDDCHIQFTRAPVTYTVTLTEAIGVDDTDQQETLDLTVTISNEFVGMVDSVSTVSANEVMPGEHLGLLDSVVIQLHVGGLPTTTIFGQELDVSDHGVAKLVVVARLVATSGWTVAGNSVFKKVAETVTDNSGNWSLDLIPTVEYEDSSAYYDISIDKTTIYTIQVKESLTPVNVRDCLVTAPDTGKGQIAMPFIYIVWPGQTPPLGLPINTLYVQVLE